MSKYWSPLVRELTPYTPGEQPSIDGLVKLNTNENPYGPSPAVLAAINEATSANLRKYPDPNSSALKKSVAHYYALNENEVFVGNSSDEVLAHTFRGLLKQQLPLLFPDITYSFYPVYCELFEIDYKRIPLDDDFQLNIHDYDQAAGGIIFANPNAPTGIALELAQLRKLLETHPNIVVVVDEAYVDFAQYSAVSLIGDYPNLLVTQTLSKSRSLAGLRVGLALGSAPLIEALERVKNSFHPYALDALALAGAEASFKDDSYFRNIRAKVIQTRESTTKGLQSLGFTVLPSQANFLFAHHPARAAVDLFRGLREQNILVRYFDAPRVSEYIRISVGTDDEMETLLRALKDILA